MSDRNIVLYRVHDFSEGAGRSQQAARFPSKKRFLHHSLPFQAVLLLKYSGVTFLAK